MKSRKFGFKIIVLVAMVVPMAACVDQFLPESLDAFDREASFTQTIFKPQLGRTTLFTGTFNPGSSTMPFEFDIVNIVRSDGSPATELMEYFPVKVWKLPYLGTEKSLAEIETKRGIEYRQLFQVRKHSGELIMWENANSGFVLCSPDSCYSFDLLASNSGGYKYTTKMRLIPSREVDFEPSNVDPETGLSPVEYINPTSVLSIMGVTPGGSSLRPRFLTEEDVQIYFRKVIDNTSSDKTLTFRFFNHDYSPIDPAKFNTTQWEKLIHGFDMEMTDEYVRYKTAYPIPLIPIKSDYTNAKGDKNVLEFSYDYFSPGTGGYRRSASMTMEFAIYKEAHWEIVFVFANADPVF